jgi:DNA-binding NtrC family response regulator
MAVSHANRAAQKTVLIVNSELAVLLLLRGMLQNNYRVLLAPDADSALRLLTLDGVRIDLAVVDCSVGNGKTAGLKRRMTEILPQLQIVSMAGSAQNGVIRLQALGASNKPTSDSLVQKIEAALVEVESVRQVLAGHVGCSDTPGPEPVITEAANVAMRVMVAGNE